MIYIFGGRTRKYQSQPANLPMRRIKFVKRKLPRKNNAEMASLK
jgi:hypothetical protein